MLMHWRGCWEGSKRLFCVCISRARYLRNRRGTLATSKCIWKRHGAYDGGLGEWGKYSGAIYKLCGLPWLPPSIYFQSSASPLIPELHTAGLLPVVWITECLPRSALWGLVRCDGAECPGVRVPAMGTGAPRPSRSREPYRGRVCP